MENKKRLIDANALLREIDGIHQRHYANSSYQFIHDFFLAMFRRIRNAPTVDAVEVVRCKDCQFSKYFIESGCRKCRSQKGLYRTVKLDDFCSWGERKYDA